MEDGGGRMAVWRRRADLRWRRTLDAVVLLPASRDEPVMLAGTGAAVWDLLGVPATLDDLVDALLEGFAGDRSVVARDVAALLEDLEALGALDRLGGAGPRRPRPAEHERG